MPIPSIHAVLALSAVSNFLEGRGQNGVAHLPTTAFRKFPSSIQFHQDVLGEPEPILGSKSGGAQSYPPLFYYILATFVHLANGLKVYRCSIEFRA
jgi:hypothetical protein